MNIEFKKTSKGYFTVFKDGIDAKYRIVNGSNGQSGNEPNMYGIFLHTVKNEDVLISWVGSLQKCKKMITYTIHWNSRSTN